MSFANAMEKKQLPQQPATQRQPDLEAAKGQSPPAFQLKAQQPIQARKDKVALPYETIPLMKGGTQMGFMTVPAGATGALPAMVIYGGQRPLGKAANMLGWTPDKYKSSHILIYSEHESKYADLKKAAEKGMADKGLSANYQTLIGYSQGGKSIASIVGSEGWSTIGLMDPLPSGEYKGGGKVLMVWDFWNSEKYNYWYKKQYQGARTKHNAPAMSKWKADEAARKQEETKTGVKTAPLPKPEQENDPMIFDQANKDPRFTLHKKITDGGYGESHHLPDLGHHLMPSTWFSMFDGKF